MFLFKYDDDYVNFHSCTYLLTKSQDEKVPCYVMLATCLTMEIWVAYLCVDVLGS